MSAILGSSLINKPSTIPAIVTNGAEQLPSKPLRVRRQATNAIGHCEGSFDPFEGRIANGLVPHSEKSTILSNVDCEKSGLKSAGVLDSKPTIPLYVKTLWARCQRLIEFPMTVFLIGFLPAVCYPILNTIRYLRRCAVERTSPSASKNFRLINRCL